MDGDELFKCSDSSQIKENQVLRPLDKMGKLTFELAASYMKPSKFLA